MGETTKPIEVGGKYIYKLLSFNLPTIVGKFQRSRPDVWKVNSTNNTNTRYSIYVEAEVTAEFLQIHTHSIHVRYIYLHLVDAGKYTIHGSYWR